MQRDEFIEDIEEQWRGGIWEDKVNRELGAAITGMIAAIALLLRNGIDPVGVCKSLMDEDNNQKLIGRRLFDDERSRNKENRKARR